MAACTNCEKTCPKGKISGHCVYYSGDYISSKDISFNDSLDEIIVKLAASSGSGGGDVTNGANLGSSGARVFSSKSGQNLQFRRIVGGTNTSVTEGTNTITIASAGDITNASNLGATGAQVFSGKSGNTLQFRKIIASTGISATQNTNDITIENTAPDQTVALSAGTGMSITGTYPTFTATNTAPDQTVVLTAGTNIDSITGTYPTFTINAATQGGGGAGLDSGDW